MNIKNYLIQIKTNGKEKIFIERFSGKKELKIFIEINFPRNKLTVLLIKEVVLIQKERK